MELTLIWTTADGTTRLVDNNQEQNHDLLVDPTAGNGQLYSFDAWDMLMMLVDNNAKAPDEHGMFFTPAQFFRRFPEWVGWSDTSFIKLLRTGSSTFRKVGGDMALRELYGIRFVRHDHEHHD